MCNDTHSNQSVACLLSCSVHPGVPLIIPISVLAEPKQGLSVSLRMESWTKFMVIGQRMRSQEKYDSCQRSMMCFGFVTTSTWSGFHVQFAAAHSDEARLRAKAQAKVIRASIDVALPKEKGKVKEMDKTARIPPMKLSKDLEEQGSRKRQG